ncbi:MAG: transporter [Bacteroidetes bacterium]|nr:MAG: transporter [Bacteroidota bacterium]
MATMTRVNPFSKVNNDTGFGTNPNDYGGRFINKDGSFNLKKEGMAFLQRFSMYHSMLNLPRWKFITLILVFYLIINFIFACIYFLIGANQMQGVIGKTPLVVFKELYFFSTETFTTVGYGRVNPVGDGANFVAAIESMCGFLSFAIATGLIFGRFSKPRAYLVFSDYALISPYHGKKALMFRFASYKDNHTLTNVEIRVNLAMLVAENDKPSYKFFDLELERNKVESLPMNWTVVHPIDERSPLLEYNFEDLKLADIELYVLVRGFDDVYSNFVLQRTSYTYAEILFDRKFIPMYRESDDGKTTILELDKLNSFVEV